MPTFPQIFSPPQAFAEVLVNELGVSMEHVATYAMDPATTSDPGLTWGYRPGRWGGVLVAGGTFTLTNNSANYLVVEIATSTPTASASNTNWNDTLNYVRVYKVTTLSGVVSAIEDHRGGPGGVIGGAAGAAGGGGSVGYEFLASSTTTDSDPGTGTLRWNNATQASATILYVDNVDGDSTSLAVLWASLTAGSLLTITDAADANVWQLWKVNAAPINGTGYYKFPVTLQTQEGGNIANTSSIRLGVDASAVDALNALGGSNDDLVQRKAGVYTNRTVAQVTTDLQGTGASSSAVGFRGLPVNSQSGTYTTVLSDVGKSIRHPSGAGAGDTFTIDSQANVAWPDGAAITFENRDSNALSIAIATDTLRYASTGTTGTRSLAQYGIATAVFDDATNEWLISGTGLS